MWFYPLVMVLVILGLAGGIVAGGIFTIVLVPLAVIVAVSAVVYAMWGRALQGGGGGGTEATHVDDRALPSQRRRPTGRTRTAPGRLADARRHQQ